MPMPVSRTRGVRACLAVATAAVVLAACGGDPVPGPATTITEPSPRPTTTVPTPTATATPSEDPNPAGLEPLPADEIDASFVTIENFFKAYEYGLKTGDAEPLRALSGDGCGTCATLVENITSFAEAKASVSGGEFEVGSSMLLNSAVPGRIAWRLDMEQALTTVVEPDGTTSEISAFDGVALFEVAGDTHQVTAIDTSSGN